MFGGEFTGSKIKLDLQNDFYVSDQHTITVGGESEWDHGEAEEGFLGFDEDLRNQALFVQDQFAFWNRLFGTVGARLDHNSEFGDEVTWRIAPAYLIHETGTKLKASYATGFKAPSLEDLFGGDGTGTFIGNPDLQPEKSRGWDAGFEQRLFEDRVSFGATYFHNKIEDLIAIDFSRRAAVPTRERVGGRDLGYRVLHRRDTRREGHDPARPYLAQDTGPAEQMPTCCAGRSTR